LVEGRKGEVFEAWNWDIPWDESCKSFAILVGVYRGRGSEIARIATIAKIAEIGNVTPITD